MRACRQPRTMAASVKNIHRLIKSASQAQPVQDAFLADLISCIERYDADQNRTPSRSYKPSSMNCVRNMYFQIMAYPPESTPNYCLTGMSETGTARHEKIQFYLSIMKDYGYDCEYIDVEVYIKQQGLEDLEVIERKGYEVKLYHKKLNIRFLCDGVVKYRGEYYIFEFKTETTHKEVARQGVAEEHYTQAATYSVCLELSGILFVYENRDNCHKKSYLLEVTDDMKYDLVISKIEDCDSYVKTMIVPPKPVEVAKKTCQYCSYRSACKKAGK